jgi:hypothetical protein
MNKFSAFSLAVLCLIGVPLRSEAAPVETDRYRVEFLGTPGKRLKASVSWSNPHDVKAKYHNEDIRRQVPIAFEIDLPLGSTVIAAGSIPGNDIITIKIFLNGFECDSTPGAEPSNWTAKTCTP